MKIIKNTSGRSTKELRKLICRTHALMRKLERRPAPNWKRLRVQIAGREDNYTSGRACLGGRGWHDWDVWLTVPRPVKQGTAWYSQKDKGKPNYYGARAFCRLVYHELMHTYGYRHHQFNDIRMVDLIKLVPEDYNLPAQPVKVKKQPEPVWKKRYRAALAAEKRWVSKQKRAVNALKKARTKVRYYERKYGTL